MKGADVKSLGSYLIFAAVFPGIVFTCAVVLLWFPDLASVREFGAEWWLLMPVTLGLFGTPICFCIEVLLRQSPWFKQQFPEPQRDVMAQFEANGVSTGMVEVLYGQMFFHLNNGIGVIIIVVVALLYGLFNMDQIRTEWSMAALSLRLAICFVVALANLIVARYLYQHAHKAVEHLKSV